MRVRVTRNRREDLLRGRDEFELEDGTASSGELSVRLEARTEAILRMLRKRREEKGEGRGGRSFEGKGEEELNQGRIIMSSGLESA
jgi:hypothetical protein